MDEKTKKTLSSITLLKTKSGPRDKDAWPTRLKEEYQSLIKVCCLLFLLFLKLIKLKINKLKLSLIVCSTK